MDKLTRLILWLLGWRSYKLIDGRGREYEAWTRRRSYFHVYHERCGKKFIRPRNPDMWRVDVY